jgi:hypothetical protein
VAEAKVQHYVPQYYLRSFVGERDMLYVVDRPREKFFRVPTKKVGGELYFNLINVKGIDPFAVEKALSEMEGIVAPCLERVKAAKSLADEKDRSGIMNLMAAVSVRNPKQRAAIDGIVNQIGQPMEAAILGSKERYDAFTSSMRSQGGEAKETFEEARANAKSTSGRFKGTQEFHVMNELQFHDHYVRGYEQRKWQILVAGEGPGGFVTSDHPVCLRWCDGQDHGNPGIAVQGTEVIFPLSPQLVLRGRFDGEENVIDADPDEVAEINSVLIGNIHNQVYAQDALFSYKRGPKGEIGSGSTLDQDKVFLAAGKRVESEKVVLLRGL